MLSPMTKIDDSRPTGSNSPSLVIATACLLSAGLGTIHAFSVLISSFEARLNLGRATVSAVYSVALVSLTASVLLFGLSSSSRRHSPRIPLGVGVLGAMGLVLAENGASLLPVLIGFGVIFGVANGIGYAYTLEIAARELPQRQGLAMGAVTAAYALGATMAAIVFETLIDRGADRGLTHSLRSLAGTLIIIGAVTTIMLRRHSEHSTVARAPVQSGSGRTRIVVRHWVSYGLAVFAGLMALGHAAEIVSSAGGSSFHRTLGTVLVAGGNATGGLAAALAADRINPSRAIRCLASATVVALLLTSLGSTTPVLLGLAGVGFSYGATIALYPFVVLKEVGSVQYPKVYGQIFTAWGVAGLAAPVLAGAIFDATGRYVTSLLVAATLAGACALVSRSQSF